MGLRKTLFKEPVKLGVRSFCLFFLLLAYKTDEMAGAPAAILDHEVGGFGDGSHKLRMVELGLW